MVSLWFLVSAVCALLLLPHFRLCFSLLLPVEATAVDSTTDSGCCVGCFAKRVSAPRLHALFVAAKRYIGVPWPIAIHI
jgi:hypothetical protein